MTNSLIELKKTLLSAVCEHPWHWIRVAVIAAVAMWISHLVENSAPVLSLRYELFQLLNAVKPAPSQGVNTVVVLIDDQAYWHGEPKGRVPLNRKYLARLLKRLAAFRPSVIGVDFDLRASDPTGEINRLSSAEGVGQLPSDPDREETLEFLDAVVSVSKETHVVLPRTINLDDQSHYISEAEVYDGYDFGESKLRFGYIALPNDMRLLPPPIELNDHQMLDSFSIAMARARFPTFVEKVDFRKLMFASFQSSNSRSALPASELLKENLTDDENKRIEEMIRSNVVVIGGGWHTRAEGRGELVDVHSTPVGLIHGADIHAQYADALMCGRVFRPARSMTVVFIELILTTIIAVLLKSNMRSRWKFGTIAGISVLPTFIGYIGITNFGVYFDLAIVTLLLILHIFVEHILEWRAAFIELRQMREGTTS